MQYEIYQIWNDYTSTLKLAKLICDNISYSKYVLKTN